jgi:hypothetical protein
MSNHISEHRNRAWATILRAIFEQQTILMEQYRVVEQLPAPPLPLHTPAAQRILKDFGWRTVEELGAAFHALLTQVRTANAPIPMAAFNELADAMHFFVEMMVFAGISADQCSRIGFPAEPPEGITNSMDELFWRPVFSLTLTMHELKCKPWKPTPVATNEGVFRQKLILAFDDFIGLWVALGASPADIDRHYFRKHRLNQTNLAERS